MNKLLIIIFLFQFHLSFSQDFKRAKYCKCEVMGERIDENVINRDSIYATVDSIDTTGLYISFYNNTTDTIFLFRSYFDDDISHSKYLYRCNKENGQIYLSYVPLLPYLTTRYSDRIIVKDRLIIKNQVVYDFSKVPPGHVYKLNLKIKRLDQIKEIVRQIDPYSFSKFDNKINFKKHNFLRNEMNTSLSIEVAYYRNVRKICDGISYYMDEIEFNKQASSFKIISTKIR